MTGKFQERIVNDSTNPQLRVGFGEHPEGQKNAGLKAVTLIATLNPVSQVLW
jgi:hypothetical protein